MFVFKNGSSEYAVNRTPTGTKLHLTYVGSSSAWCNGRSGRFSPLSKQSVARAKPSQFCDKCASEEFAAKIIAAAQS